MIFLQILTAADSTIISKIDAIAKSMVELKKEVALSPWVPFLTALLGGILVILGQYFERRSNRKQAKQKDIIESFTNCELLLFSLKSLVKEFSGYKNLSMYWHYSHIMEDGKHDGDKALSKKYYDNSLTQSTAAIECKSKIGALLAQYYSGVSKFQTLSQNKFDVAELKNLQSGELFEAAAAIEKSKTPAQALEIFHANHLALSNKYLSLLAPLDKINNTMDSICQTLNK